MGKKLFFVITLALVLYSCSYKAQQNQDIVSIDSTTITTSNKSIYDRLLEEIDSADVYNDSILCGYWFQPHAASVINIFFHKDNSYEFKYCENGKDNVVIDILKKGKYTINGDLITLTSEDGWDDYFNGVMYYKNNGTNYYLTSQKGIFYLVKGSD